MYDEDYYTDQPVDFRVSEIIREQLFAELGEEIPYASYVEIANVDNGNILSIQAYIHTETESQKKILIGKNGSKIQEIGKKVFLGLRVKVDKNWRKNQKTLEKLFPKR